MSFAVMVMLIDMFTLWPTSVKVPNVCSTARENTGVWQVITTKDVADCL